MEEEEEWIENERKMRRGEEDRRENERKSKSLTPSSVRRFTW